MRKSKNRLFMGIILIIVLSLLLLWGCTRGSIGEEEIESGEENITEETSSDQEESEDAEAVKGETDEEDNETDEKEDQTGEEEVKEAEEQETGESGEENSQEQDAEEKSPEEDLKEEKEQETGENQEQEENDKGFVTNASNWVHFNESNFQRLLKEGDPSKTHLTYQDFYQEITYQLMMREEKVREIFGEPVNKVEDTSAYYMRTLEYNDMEIHFDDYGHGYIASTYFIKTSGIPGPRGTRVGDTVAEILMAYPLPENGGYSLKDGQVRWGEQTDNYSTFMGTLSYSSENEITELRYVEVGGYAAAVYEIHKGKVESIHFFEMN